MLDSDQRFWDMVRKPKRQKRNCLHCKKEFTSTGNANRYCSNCKRVVETQAKLQEKQYEVNI
jgi:predicted amidophosphoribosyltransferase